MNLNLATGTIGANVLASANLATGTTGILVSADCLCPDLLRYEQIGAADGPRGRVIRGFFWLLRAWPPRGMR